MTKFILVGGYAHKAPDGGKAFADALVQDKAEPIKLLDCLFARPRENWEKAFAQDKDFFTRMLSEKKLEIRLAHPDTFAEQIRWADSIYIRGGENR